MSTPQETWESASIPPPEPTVEPVAPIAEPIVETPPAEAVTLVEPETPQIDAEPVAARESESQEQITPPEKVEAKPDDYVAEADDPPEIAALSTPAAKRWAKRQYQDARPIHTFLDFDKPIQGLGDELFTRSPSRYTEHVNDIFRRHSKDLLGVPFDEVKTRLQTNGQPVTTTTPEVRGTQPPVTLPTEDDLAQMSNDQVAQRFKDVQAAQQAAQQAEQQRLQAEFQQKVDDLKMQLDAVTGEVTTNKQTAQQVEIDQKQNELLNNVLTVIEDGIRNSGLEVQPTDPPKIANLKRAAQRLLDKQPVVAAFDAVDDNQKLVKYVTEAINRREFQNAFREEDNLKVRARAAFESVKQSPEVQAILSEIEAYAAQSKSNSRGANPVPPAPGSSVGINIKPPTTWDEAVAAS